MYSCTVYVSLVFLGGNSDKKLFTNIHLSCNSTAVLLRHLSIGYKRICHSILVYIKVRQNCFNCTKYKLEELVDENIINQPVLKNSKSLKLSTFSILLGLNIGNPNKKSSLRKQNKRRARSNEKGIYMHLTHDTCNDLDSFSLS